MTVLAVFADPPRPGLVLSELSPAIEPAAAAELYAASLKDTLVAGAESGGDLLINYRPNERLPDPFRREETAEEAVRTLAAEALGDLGDVRFEVQVGSTHAARAGNTVTHLLREEAAASVAVLDGTAPFLSARVIDAAAMKLRRSEVVLGPAQGGHVSYVGFTDAIDFADAWSPPELATLVERARAADLAVDFVERQPVLRTEADLATVVAEVAARRRADRPVPSHTAAAVDRIGLSVVDRDGERGVEST